MNNPFWNRTTISAIRKLDDPSGHSHIVSMLDPEWPHPEQFDSWPQDRRVILRFHDEIAPRENRVLPDEDMVRALIAFGERAQEHDGDDVRLFIHCQSGMSRSTAGALILWAARHPEAADEQLFSALDRIRAGSWPNTLMLSIADDMLNRPTRMADAAIPFFAERLKSDDELRARMTKLRRVPDLERVDALTA